MSSTSITSVEPRPNQGAAANRWPGTMKQMRPFQSWNCGDSACPIKTKDGKRLERVVVWTQLSLETLRQVIDSNRLQCIPCVDNEHKKVLIQLIGALEGALKNPYDQSLHEQVWDNWRGRLLSLYNSHTEYLLEPWIPPLCEHGAGDGVLPNCRCLEGIRRKANGVSLRESSRKT